MTESKIIFYDLASNGPEFCWSLNTWKTRFALNYKGIPYKTEWVELPEIEEKCKEIGIPISAERYQARRKWHIHFASDLGFPDQSTPSVLFDGIEAYDQVMNGALNVPEFRSLILFLMHYDLPLMNPVSQEWYKSQMEARFGKKWEDISPTGEAKAEAWKGIKRGFDTLDAFLQENARPSAEDGQLSYFDIALGGHLYALRLVWGEENELWRDLSTWNDGRWAKYVEKVEEYKTPKEHDN